MKFISIAILLALASGCGYNRSYHVIEAGHTPMGNRVVISSVESSRRHTDEDLFFIARNARMACNSEYRLMDYLSYNDGKAFYFMAECQQ